LKKLQIPVEHSVLENGLRVVISPDASAPFVTVGVYYQIGFRLEPRGRSGFAHLFEHMMFQGSENAGKTVHIKLINSSGGVLNGTTHYDVTNPCRRTRWSACCGWKPTACARCTLTMKICATSATW
jgi:zinc protease